MKIDNVSHTTTLKPIQRKTAKKEQVTENFAASPVAPKVQLSDKINNWFAQAGIQHPDKSQVKRDVDARVSRRQRLALQRKLHNLEAILHQALNIQLESNHTDNLDPDWFFSFIALAEEIYSPAMQELWGKIFAAEVAQPGSFSLNTLQTLKQLTHKDAQLFKLAASLSCRKKGGGVPRLLVGYYVKPAPWQWFKVSRSPELNMSEFGLSYPNLLMLMELGLIYRSEIESGEILPQQSAQWRYGQTHFVLTARKRGMALHYYKFTSTGSELFRLVSGAENSKYFDALVALLQQGFDVRY